MKAKNKTTIAIIWGSILLALYALAAYVFSLPHSQYAGFIFLAIFAADIFTFVLSDILEDRNKRN
jgi:hypothetical protein